MNLEDILIFQAVTTVIQIARTGDMRSKFRRQLLKIFRTIAVSFQADEEFMKVAREVSK